MDKNAFVTEVERRFRLRFRASKDGYKTSDSERHHLEGFIEAGIFLDLTTREAMQALMESVHLEVFGITLQERQVAPQQNWPQEAIDYSRFDTPPSQRR